MNQGTEAGIFPSMPADHCEAGPGAGPRRPTGPGTLSGAHFPSQCRGSRSTSPTCDVYSSCMTHSTCHSAGHLPGHECRKVLLTGKATWQPEQSLVTSPPASHLSWAVGWTMVRPHSHTGSKARLSEKGLRPRTNQVTDEA